MTPEPTKPAKKDPETPAPRTSAGNAIEKAATGIAGFDEITGGGIPAHRTTLILGGPGAGKTIFALEALVTAANTQREPGVFVAFEESSSQIIANAATFGWDIPTLERERLFFLDARLAPTTVQAGDFDLTGMLAGLGDKIKAMGAKRIVFDGIDVLLAVLDEPAKERREVHRLHQWLQELGLTAILTAKSSEADRAGAERYGFMQYMVDAVVSLEHRMLDRVSLRSVRVLKYRGSAFSENEFPMIIADHGIEVSTFGSSRLDYEVSTDRISTGVPRLDTMLDGGYYEGSVILITGAPGVAKTTLAGAFASAACSRGDRVLYVSFDEAGSQLIRNLRSVGMDLGDCNADGTLSIHAVRTESRSAEEHLIGLRRALDTFEPKCLILDPLSALAKTGGSLAAMHTSLRLLDLARARGITVLCTSLVSVENGLSEMSSAQISTIADTWIHLEYLVSGGERNRTLTVVKSRGMAHSNQVRELILSNDGVTLTDVYTAGGNVLLGTARWEHENAVHERESMQEAERIRRRRAAEHAGGELRSRIATLQLELETHKTELELLDKEDRGAGQRKEEDRSELRRLRHADEDTRPAREPWTGVERRVTKPS
jgi:circadian clock protein KaiC